ncbi:MAG TPA: response regulator, partial [Roseomonas sp.]|nr:response regulator [Roseomonas sp.]
ADRLRTLVADAVPHPAGDGARVTLSAGVAGLDGATTLDAALAVADRALYAAKAAGRDRVVIG